MKAIILVHGIGKPDKNWSKSLQDYLGDSYHYHECNWDLLIKDTEKSLFQRLFKKPPIWKPNKLLHYFLKGIIFKYALDATSYSSFKPIMTRMIKEAYHNLSNKRYEIFIVAHSLGSWAVYDAMREDQYVCPDKLITYGANLPLNKLDSYRSFPRVEWYNIWEDNDILSMPLKKNGIIDIEFKNNLWLFKSNPLSHIAYLKSNKFKSLVKRILEDKYYE